MNFVKKISIVFIAALIVSTSVSFNNTVKASSAAILRVGSTGTLVSELQQDLKDLGYFTYNRATGYYGYITRDSVIRFQRDNNLYVDGIAGPRTLARIESTLNGEGISTHVVALGDSLWTISLRYGTTIYNLKAINNLSTDTIYPGQVLKISGQATQVAAPANESENPDLYWLSRIIEAESGAEPYNGKVAVGNVVLNRRTSGDFPNTIKGVIFEYYNGIPQFSPVADGTIYNNPSQESLRAAVDALNGVSPVGSATYFFNPDKSLGTWIVNNKTYVTRIGEHVFYR